MKKLTVISILVVLALGQCGYYCFYAFQLHAAKKEAKHKLLKTIPEKLLTTFSADDNRIRWKDDGDELCVNGKMYDVVKRKLTGAQELVLCIADEQEDALLEQLSRLLAYDTASAGGKHNNKAPVRAALHDWFFETTGNSIFEVNTALENPEKKYAVYNELLKEMTADVITPPPNTNI